ncbi:MAG: helicase [Candidatus Hydrogenedentes bacterium]|nr:helicase [Candidatus Hydrogenedentota bacterium]
MPSHDIIDNRKEKLVENILAILPQSEKARFAVGYLFLSGLEAIGHSLGSLTELKLLVGNTSSRETIELLAEGYRRLDMVEDCLEAQRYPKRSEQRRRVDTTALNIRESMEMMDQTDAGQDLARSLLDMIEHGRLQVRVYTKGRLHAKAYIFDFARPNPGNSGMAIVGSSNLTLAGVRDNTELNVLVHDNASPLRPGDGNHAALVAWFDELWSEAQDFDSYLMKEIEQSWAVQLATPYDIYLKTLYTLVEDRLDGTETTEILWDDEITRRLADFQRVAVRQAIQMIRDNGGCFVADVVGLGKSYIGAAIIKHFERTEHARPLVICPKPLEGMWIRYNETYHLNAHVLPMSMLQTDPGRGVNMLEDVRYRDRDFVLVDESHNFRHHSSQRYEELQRFISTGRKVCLLTATPRNSRALDLYHQIKLFHPEEKTYFPIDPPDLREYFRLIDNGGRRLEDLLRHVLIRRQRRHILRWYGYADDTQQPLRELDDDHCGVYLNGGKRAYVLVAGRHQYFPKRELDTLRYSIEETYQGLYQTLRANLGRPRGEGRDVRPGQELTYARYGLWRYVHIEKQKQKPYTDLQRAGFNLRGLIRTSLFKRFESSVEAFRLSLKRMVRTHEMFVKAIDQGFLPAGEDAEALLGRSGQIDDDDLLCALEEVAGQYDLRDFNSEILRSHIQADIELLKSMVSAVMPITPEHDAKLQTLLHRLKKPPIGKNKCLIFTQFADTAKYIFDNVNPHALIKDVDIIFGTDKSKQRIVGRFSPQSNPELAPHHPEQEIRLLIATDVLAEGLNLQDCSVVVNYDLHWNPVRLIQRFGRIDRIGSEFGTIHGLNFLPETGIDRNLGLTTILSRRIAEIHETIGEDAAILDKNEMINEKAMYAIYQDGKLGVEHEGEEDLLDLNEAEEFFRNLARDTPGEFERIQNLRDGIRSGKSASEDGSYVFCKAGRYNQLFLIGTDGQIISRDLPRVLSAIKATQETPTMSPLPQGYNKRVMSVRDLFAHEVKHRQSERDHTMSLRLCQRYVLRELRTLFAGTDDEDRKAQISELERAFRLTPTAALTKELNSLRRNGVTAEALIKSLTTIYHQHRLRDRIEQDENSARRLAEFPRIVCSEALIWHE